MNNLQPTFNIYRANVIVTPLQSDAIEARIKVVIETVLGVPYSVYSLRCRKRELTFPRQLYSYLLYNYTRLSLAEVGRRLNPQAPYAHDIVIHSRSVIEGVLDFPRDDRYMFVKEAINMMDGYRRVKQSTLIVNKSISAALRQRNKDILKQNAAK